MHAQLVHTRLDHLPLHTEHEPLLHPKHPTGTHTQLLHTWSQMPTYESFGVPSNYHVGTWTLRDSSQAKRNSPTYGATPCTPALINNAWCMIRGQSGGIILPWMEETLHRLHPVRGNRVLGGATLPPSKALTLSPYKP